MDEQDRLAVQFEAHRTHLRAVAYRMLGSVGEADDAVQEAWLRLSRSDTSDIENLGGWLTTVVSRICLDVLRSHASRREEPIAVHGSEPAPLQLAAPTEVDPEHEAVVADSIGLALLVVLDTLTPPERIAFVLHDLFAVPFDDIAPVLGRSPDAARQLASRARRRVQGAGPDGRRDVVRQRAVVDAFLAAARGGDLQALVALLDPDVVVMADEAAIATGAEAEVCGAVAVAGTFAGRARVARPALIDGQVGLVWAPGGTVRVAFDFSIVDDRVVAIDLIADGARLAELEIELLGAE